MSKLDLVTEARNDPGADVLIVTNFWPHEANPAYGIFAKRQVDSLIARGLRCDVLSLRGFAGSAAYPLAALKLAGASLRPRRQYRLVHAHGGEAGVVARFYARAPLVVTYYGSDLLGIWDAAGGLSPARRLRRWIVRESARAAAATVTQSREMEQALPLRARRRNRVIPNGIDTRLFRPLDREECRRALGWSDEERVVLFAANPEAPVKRFPLAQEAFRRSRGLAGPVRLEVAWGISPAEMPRILSAADCLLLTSRAEGSPNVVKEAVMCDLPVVTTEVGDVRDVLAGVEPSWICRDDPDDLARAVAECVGRAERSNGSKVAGRLALEAVAEEVLALYADVGASRR